MNRLPYLLTVLAALFCVAADKPQPTPSPVQIQKWVKQLGDDSFKVREEATRNLIKAREAAYDAVTKATKSEDPEVKQRALRIVKQMEKPAIAYFKKLGGGVKVDEKSPGTPVIELDLGNAKITDAGLVHLKGLTNLRQLSLGSADVTDAGLVHLKGLLSLKCLRLKNAKVTGAGLVHLKGLTNLQELMLYHTKVTDAGLVHLKGLTKLRGLWLRESIINDAGLVHLKGLSNLRHLDLWGTKVTDAGLVHLKGLTSLKTLSLRDTKVTKAGIQKLQKALPDCKISH